MVIIISITDVISNMNKFSNYSHFEDIKRIKSGYMPKRHFISLYNMAAIFMVSKLFLYRACKNFIAGFFNYAKLQKSPMIPSGIYDHPR
jgi:hypothetical protein